MVIISPRTMFLPVFHKNPLLPPLSFIDIYNLYDGLQCNPILFSDDNSFATVHNINKSTNDLSNGLTKITKWAFQWKISFNPDISKQVFEVIFPAKGL